MWYVLGLGNPGEQYAYTRHNAGALITGAIAERYGCDDVRRERDLSARICSSDDIMFLFSEVYMNNSGEVVAGLCKRDPATAQQLVVIHDDIDLPLGEIKLARGGAGGHRGVSSVVNVLGTDQFIRIKIGVSPIDEMGMMRKPQKERVSSFVLAPMSSGVRETLMEQGVRASDALTCIVNEGFPKAQSLYNA